MSKDLEAAKNALASHSIALHKDGTTYTSELSGVAPMLDFIARGVKLDGFSAADKIIGKAAAMLFALAGVTAVYGEVMSRSAVKTLDGFGIENSCGVLTDEIINRAGNGCCPMEAAVRNIDNPSEAYEAIKKRVAELRAKG